MSDEQKQPAAVILRDSKYRLAGQQPLPGGKRPPNVTVKVTKKGPAFELRTNVENDKNYGLITAVMDAPMFFGALAALSRIIKGESNKHFTFKNNAVRWVDRKPTEPKLDTKLTFGKDAEGVVFIAITSWEEGRPIAKIPFLPSANHGLVNETGNPLSNADLSCMVAEGFLKMWSSLTPQILIEDYVPPPPPGGQQGGGNFQGGGGGYNRGGGGGGYNNNRGGGNYGGGGGGGGNYGGGGGGNSNGGSSDAGFGGEDLPF